MQRKVNKICRWLDLNCRSLVLDATTQPAAPQPLPEKRVLFTCNLQWKVPKSLKWRAIVKHEVSLYDLSTISFSCRLMQREWTSLVFWKKVVVLVRLFSETFIIGLSQTINRGSKMHFSKEMFKRKLQNFFNFPPLYSVPFIFFYQSISMPIFRAVHLVILPPHITGGKHLFFSFSICLRASVIFDLPASFPIRTSTAS